MRKYIEECRKAGANPVLMSLTPRDAYGKDGKIVRKQQSQWLEQISREQGVPYVDLNEISAAKLDKYGRWKESYHFYKDHIHTSKFGAEMNARSAAEGIAASTDPALAPLQAMMHNVELPTVAVKREKGKPVVFITGDSTVKNTDKDPDGMWGWGSQAATVFDTDKDAPTNINIPGKGYLKIFQAGSGLVIEDLKVDQIEDVFSTLNAMTARKVLLVHRQRELDDFVSGDTLRSDMDSIFSRREGMSFSSPDFSEKISDTGVRIMEMEARFSRWIDEANRFEDQVSSCMLSDDFGRRIAGEYLVSTKTLDMLAQYRKLLSSWRESYRAQYGSLEFIKTMGDYVDSHQEAERQRRERRVGTALNIVAIFAIVSAVKDGSDLFLSLVDHAGVHDAATPARLMIAIASCILLVLCLSFVLWWTWKANKVDSAQHKRERGRIRRIVGEVRPQLRLLFLCIFLCCLAIVVGGIWGAFLVG